MPIALSRAMRPPCRRRRWTEICAHHFRSVSSPRTTESTSKWGACPQRPSTSRTAMRIPEPRLVLVCQSASPHRNHAGQRTLHNRLRRMSMRTATPPSLTFYTTTGASRFSFTKYAAASSTSPALLPTRYSEPRTRRRRPTCRVTWRTWQRNTAPRSAHALSTFASQPNLQSISTAVWRGGLASRCHSSAGRTTVP